MPLVASSYMAPPWLPGAHLQTIVPARFMRLPTVQYRRDVWTRLWRLIDVDFACPRRRRRGPVLVMFHGWRRSQSHYPFDNARSRSRWAWSYISRLLRRSNGCSALITPAPRTKSWILRAVHFALGERALYAVGNSLGEYAGSWALRGQDLLITSAASIGSRLIWGVGRPRRGSNVIRVFLATLKTKALAKVQQFPEIERDGDYKRRLRASRNLYEFDNEYTAPMHGFRNTEDYWDRASGKRWLQAVRIPYLLLNARNDPFVPAASLPQPRDVSEAVELEQPAHGGHIGFARGPWPGRIDFIAERLHLFFTQREPSLP